MMCGGRMIVLEGKQDLEMVCHVVVLHDLVLVDHLRLVHPLHGIHLPCLFVPDHADLAKCPFTDYFDRLEVEHCRLDPLLPVVVGLSVQDFLAD